jgi:hypothetical protein
VDGGLAVRLQSSALDPAATEIIQMTLNLRGTGHGCAQLRLPAATRRFCCRLRLVSDP